MNFNELANLRRSVRGFNGNEISDNEINSILDAAQAAPSAGNRQPWKFYAIKNKEVIADIHARACNQNSIITAPFVIVVCTDMSKLSDKYGERGKNLYCIQDTAAAIENILLCAASLGLGSCWCGAYKEDVVVEILKLGEGVRPVAIIPIGRFDSLPDKAKRRPFDEVVEFIN